MTSAYRFEQLMLVVGSLPALSYAAAPRHASALFSGQLSFHALRLFPSGRQASRAASVLPSPRHIHARLLELMRLPNSVSRMNTPNMVQAEFG